MIKPKTRSNQSREVTAEKLKAFTLNMRKQGKLILPAERDLCRALNCSRNNLRQVLEEFERNGDIVMKSRSRALSMEKITGQKKLGAFAFVAEGENMIKNLAWNKLWMKTSALAEAADIAPELCLISYHADREAALRQVLDGPEVIVVANTMAHDFTRKIVSLPEKKVIVLDEQFSSPDKALITIDNYDVGFKAARELATHGYKRPAWLCEDIRADGALYKMYARRLEGFRAGLAKFKLEFDANSEFLIRGNRVQFLIRLIKFIETLKDRPFDSIFFYADNSIDYLWQSLMEEGARVPEDLGIITVNCFDRAIGHTPRVSSVSHATFSVASKLVETLTIILKNNQYPTNHVYLKPTIHPGNTL